MTSRIKICNCDRNLLKVKTSQFRTMQNLQTYIYKLGEIICSTSIYILFVSIILNIIHIFIKIVFNVTYSNSWFIYLHDVYIMVYNSPLKDGKLKETLLDFLISLSNAYFISSIPLVIIGLLFLIFGIICIIMGKFISIINSDEDQRVIDMNGTMVAVLVRQFIVRTIYLAPFVLGFLYIPSPMNILAACLLVLKSKLPSDTDLYELQALGKHVALMLTRVGTETDRKNMDLMKQAFGFGDEVLHQADVDGASAKFLVDTLFGIIEAVAVVVMVIWYLMQTA